MRLFLTTLLLALPSLARAHATIETVSIVVQPNSAAVVLEADPLRVLVLAQTSATESRAQIDCNSASIYDPSDDTNVRLSREGVPFVAQGADAQAVMVCWNEGSEPATVLATEIVAPTIQP